jgi:hypothetical protein
MTNRIGEKLFISEDFKSIYGLKNQKYLYVIGQSSVAYLCWSPVPNWPIASLAQRDVKKFNISDSFIMNSVQCVWVAHEYICYFEQ